MLRTPASTAVIGLTIALGAGVNATVFFAINNALAHARLPDADSLVWVDDGKPLAGATYPDHVDYCDRTTAFEDLAAFALANVGARRPGDDHPRKIRAVLASGNYFSVLRTSALSSSFLPSAGCSPRREACSDCCWRGG